jgi:hypothetical protein
MTPKEISRLATAQFLSAIPAHWARRNQQDQEDYGVDYELELMRPNDTATGFLFKVQQKGELQLEMDADGKHVKISGFSVSKLEYYLDLSLPVILVAVDVTAKRVFWVPLQGNSDVQAALRAVSGTDQKTITVRLPVDNELPASADQLIAAVSRVLDFLVVQGITEIRGDRLLDTVLAHMDLDQVTAQLRARTDIMRCQQIEQLLAANRVDEAFAQAGVIFDSGSESLATRFAAGLYLVKAETRSAITAQRGDRDERVLIARLSMSQQLLQLVRPHVRERRLRAYALFQLRAACLRGAIEQDYALYFSDIAQRGASDPLGAATHVLTKSYRQHAALRVLRGLRAIQRCIHRLVQRGYLDLLPQAWAILVQDLSLFASRLREEGLDATTLVTWLDDVGEAALFAARHLEQWHDVALVAIQQVTLADAIPTDIARRAQKGRDILASMPNGAGAERDRSLRFLNQLEHDLINARREVSYDEETLLIERIARAQGIDLDHPTDRIAQVVRIGLRDRNPERVLRQCIHLQVRLGSSGIPAQMLGLPTAGSKALHCVKHGFCISGLALDDTYRTFEMFYCRKCTDGQPQPADWKWTPQWQREQENEHRLAEVGGDPPADLP